MSKNKKKKLRFVVGDVTLKVSKKQLLRDLVAEIEDTDLLTLALYNRFADGGYRTTHSWSSMQDAVEQSGVTAVVRVKLKVPKGGRL